MMPPIRIAMWSGPRNISTAMMRSFENRGDCAVTDEPFYAAYLAATGADHPMRAESLASQPNDPQTVAEACAGDVPGGKPVWYQKHMTHHMRPGFPMEWTKACRHAFLIRDPAFVVASYVQKRADPAPDDLGFTSQWQIFDREAQRLGHAPPVIDTADVLANPRRVLTALCAALDIPFTDKMLEWPAGRRASDGVWAPVWYGAVERSTGFAASPPPPPPLPERLRPLADAGRDAYARLSQYRIGT